MTATSPSRAIFGCENGAVYFVDNETNQLTEHGHNYRAPVTFIKQLRPDLRLFGTNNCHYTILNDYDDDQCNVVHEGCVVDAFIVYGVYVIVILQDCKFDVINILTKEKFPVILDYYDGDDERMCIRSCALADNILVLGYEKTTIFVSFVNLFLILGGFLLLFGPLYL